MKNEIKMKNEINMKNKNIDKKYKLRFLVVAMLSFNKTKSLGFERGSLTDASKSFGKKYNVDVINLGAYVSHIKTFNNYNNKSFVLSIWYQKVIAILNTMNNDELYVLIDVIDKCDDNFNFLAYLKENYEN